VPAIEQTYKSIKTILKGQRGILSGLLRKCGERRRVYNAQSI